MNRHSRTPQSSPRRPEPRVALTALRCFFDSSRFSRAPAPGLVGFRRFGRFAAACSSATNRARAASRFCACVRCSRLSISSTPSAVMRRPASAISRSLTSVRERRVVDAEAQLDRGGHLVDVLAAWPGRADEPLLEVALVDRDGVSDLYHRRRVWPFPWWRVRIDSVPPMIFKRSAHRRPAALLAVGDAARPRRSRARRSVTDSGDSAAGGYGSCRIPLTTAALPSSGSITTPHPAATGTGTSPHGRMGIPSPRKTS